MSRILALMAAALLSACAVGPDYRQPADPAVAYHGASGAGVSTEPFEAAWWEQFGDPTLDGLIERALVADLDLQIAVARVREARAFLGAERRDRWPSAAVQAAHDERNAQQPGFGDERLEIDSTSLGVATVWELDLFGSVRRRVEAASAGADGALAELRDAQVLVAAEVARNYLELRGAQKRLAVARSNFGYQRETLELTRVRLQSRPRKRRSRRSWPPSASLRTGSRFCWACNRAASTTSSRRARSRRTSRRSPWTRPKPCCAAVRTFAQPSARWLRPRRASASRRRTCSRGSR
jgi:hypothetical protein